MIELIYFFQDCTSDGSVLNFSLKKYFDYNKHF